MAGIPWSATRPDYDLCAKVGPYWFDVTRHEITRRWRWRISFNAETLKASEGYYDTRDEAEAAITKLAKEMELIKCR